ncbi:MAG: hypothetical protein R3A79_24820 [Nannocystaceae bacterium]
MCSRRSTALALALPLALLGLGIAGCGGHANQDPTTSASASLTAHQGAQEQDPATPAPAPADVAPAPADDDDAADDAAPERTALDAGDLRPLTEDERARFFAGDGDTLAPTEIHYVKSNEIRHDVWFPYIAELGGAYVGVGSDQNYTLIATAKSDLVFLMDIDRRVVDLHAIYGILIAASEDAETLFNRWDSANAEASLALIEAALEGADEDERRRMIRSFKGSRETVYRNLRHVLSRTRDGAPTSWLSNPEMYDHIRKLWLAGRVRTLGGNFVGDAGLQTVGKVARDLGIPVRVLYMSNAEEYFRYTDAFATNIKALVGDDKSIALRTIYSKDWEHADNLWGYQVQPLADFQARLDDKKNRSRNPMLRYAEQDGTLQRTTSVSGLSLLAVPEAPLAGG